MNLYVMKNSIHTYTTKNNGQFVTSTVRANTLAEN